MTNIKKSLIFIVTLGSISSLYSSTISGSGGRAASSGVKIAPEPKMIGGQAEVYHGGQSSQFFPFFSWSELKGAHGETGGFFQDLQIAYLIDSAGKVTYFTNATIITPASTATPAAYTLNFATTTIDGKTVSLHGVTVTQDMIDTIKAQYNRLMGLIPAIIANASMLQNKTISQLWEMGLQLIGTLLPKSAYVG